MFIFYAFAVAHVLPSTTFKRVGKLARILKMSAIESTRELCDAQSRQMAPHGVPNLKLPPLHTRQYERRQRNSTTSRATCGIQLQRQPIQRLSLIHPSKATNQIPQ